MRNKIFSISLLAVVLIAGAIARLISKLAVKSEAKAGKILAKSASVESKISKKILDDLPTKTNTSKFSNFQKHAANPAFDNYMYSRLVSASVRVGARALARTNHLWRDSADHYRVLYVSEDLFAVHQALRDLE
jgi:thiaminase